MAPVGIRLEVRRILGIDDEPVALQLELARDLGAQQADDVGCGRDLVSGPRLLGDRGPADVRPALDDQHRKAAPRQVRRRDEPVAALQREAPRRSPEARRSSRLQVPGALRGGTNRSTASAEVCGDPPGQG